MNELILKNLNINIQLKHFTNSQAFNKVSEINDLICKIKKIKFIFWFSKKKIRTMNVESCQNI